MLELKELYNLIKKWRQNKLYKNWLFHIKKVKTENNFIINNKHAEIGEYTFIGSHVIVGPATKSIGKFCSIGSGAIIGPNSHDIKKVTTSSIPFLSKTPEDFFAKRTAAREVVYSRYKAELNKHKVMIEDDVWIGHNAIIMPGVRIGTGAIIGAAAVVTKDVEPYSMVVGIPAHQIGKRFSEKTINLLLEHKLYQRPPDLLLALFNKYATHDLEDILNDFLSDLLKIPLID